VAFLELENGAGHLGKPKAYRKVISIT